MDFERPKRHPFQRKKKPGPPFFLTERDHKVMQYIWRWKIASTASIHDGVSGDNSPYSTYKNLERMERNGLIECRFENIERFFVWQLTERGFQMIKNYLPELKEEGFLSENYRHDRLVQAFHLGEWTRVPFESVTLFTEQEMRRMDVADYPEWVPHTVEHRPDGYTRITGAEKSCTIAHEVELSAKNVQKYEGILRFYRTERLVNRVLWLVASRDVRRAIIGAKANIKDESVNFHLFVDLVDYQKNGWDAVIVNERSETLFSVRKYLWDNLGGTYPAMTGIARGHKGLTVHLENNKVLGKPRA